jgi:CubicO group peptidase (beta-lactamase class C family)
VHASGLGESFTGGPVPGAATVFRIASMTKSFTASAVMLLRADGVLALDDPAHQYLPGLRGLQLPAGDCRPVTIRQLLTMTAGFPTDDPWGDRQQGLPLDAFDELIAGGGVRCCWAPGTRFEYSNLGYALLGRIVAAVTGGSYETAIRQMLLAPLGLDRTVRGGRVRRGQPGPRLPPR